MSEPDYSSLVPRYTFAETLAEQEAELKDNPLLRRMIASREAKSGDPHRPVYHYVNPEKHAERPQRALFLAGPLAPLLPGLSTGRPQAALGTCGQRRPHPLARPPLRDLPRPRRVLLFRWGPGRGRTA